MKQLAKALHNAHCLVFIDLEGTQATHEIIEIGAYKVILNADCTIKKIHKPLHCYVIPKHKIGPFVTKLTGITDLQLKKEGIPYRLALEKIKKYVGKDFRNPTFVSYGSSDAAMFLASSENNMDASTDDSRFISRHFFDLESFIGQFCRDDKGNHLSLVNSLKTYEVDFVGTAHNAQDDAYNLILLYDAFTKRTDITIKEYKKILSRGATSGPIASAVVSRLAKGETVTPEMFHKIVEDCLK